MSSDVGFADSVLDAVPLAALFEHDISAVVVMPSEATHRHRRSFRSPAVDNLTLGKERRVCRAQTQEQAFRLLRLWTECSYSSKRNDDVTLSSSTCLLMCND